MAGDLYPDHGVTGTENRQYNREQRAGKHEADAALYKSHQCEQTPHPGSWRRHDQRTQGPLVAGYGIYTQGQEILLTFSFCSSLVSGYVITYFPLRGRSETIRLILSDQGAKWTEEEVQFTDWFTANCEHKKQAVFGQLPKFKDGDFVLYQSNSILRYLGRKYGIAGGSNQESALIDMVNDGVEDLRMKLVRVLFYEPEKGTEKYEADLPDQFSAFERILSQNSNGTRFVVGDQISYADYNLLDILHVHLALFPACLASFPLLTAFSDRISSRPKLMEYLKSEARKNRPIVPKK
ncbi:glutathione S-transferase P 1-like [Leptodactylus fuscus]|uniref:glutathione S-transferase P 1-like n=1 Tax=Leptodactylus fuscus TaxID=238119 RepID=UPI003F4F135F